MFSEEINTESDLVEENLVTEDEELYFQDLPIYDKLNISSAKVGEKNHQRATKCGIPTKTPAEPVGK